MAQSATTVQGSSAADKLKLLIAVLLVIGGIALYYILADQQQLVRVAAVILGVVAGLGVALSSNPGQAAWKFTTSARTEVRKVVWPTRRETMQVTLFVFIAVVIIGIMLWIMDRISFWLIYDLLLDARIPY